MIKPYNINKSYYQEYQHVISRLFNKTNKTDFLTKNITLQVTEDCNFACTYCYQHNKTSNKMTFETAKQIIDSFLKDEDIINNYLALIIEFIGGEPLLEIELIDKITEYFFDKLSKINFLLASRSRISMISNGLLYFDERVQKYLDKYKNFVSFAITLDGYKELHDSCRVTKNGEPTYDYVLKAVQHRIQKNGYIGSKLTFAKENIQYASKGVINLLELNIPTIHCNCAFEPEWDLEDAKILYKEFKIVADYIIDNDLEDKVECSMFNHDIGTPYASDGNWCGGNGAMLAADWQGKWYPCLRYMPSSLGNSQQPIECGDIIKGINHSVLENMQKINRASQSTEECMNCSVASGCAWCSAYNYEVYGTINKRVTNICVMHKARSLINTYFYNKIFHKHGIPDRLTIYLDKKEALKIISEDEWEELKRLESE